MSDLIRREDAIDELMALRDAHKADQFTGDLLHWTGIKAMLESIPSAEPDRKRLAMKTLDEVIEAIDFCKSGDLSKCKDCPYIGTCELDYAVLSDDALHYLREYREKAKDVDQILDSWRYESKWNEEANNPLTWDELRTMEGKPVWIEGEHGCIWGQKAWSLIRLDPENDDLITCVSTDGGVHYEFAIGQEDYGTDWQAFRKERP